MNDAPTRGRQMIERKSWSQGRTCITHVQLPGDRQKRQHFLVHERIVPMWLANVTSSRITDGLGLASARTPPPRTNRDVWGAHGLLTAGKPAGQAAHTSAPEPLTAAPREHL